MLRALLFSLVFTAQAWGETLELTNFQGLNNSADAAVIGDGQSQDLLNVEANKAGNGIRKRAGYAAFLTLSTAAPSVGSGVGIKNASGDECMIFASSGTVWRSINQSAPVQVTTITLTARLYCAPNNGVAYCFSSANDTPFTFDCNTYTAKLSNNYTNGKFSAFTPDRQVVAGSTSALNTLHFSKSGDFSDFRTGNAIVDAWNEDVGTAGDRVTGVFWINGRVIAFKEYAAVGFNCTDQFNCAAYNVTDRVGISNIEAAIQMPGELYFKGSDNEIYVTDGGPGSLTKISHAISSTTASLLTGKTRYSLLATKADWDQGNLTNNGAGAAVRSDIVTGSILPSSTSITETTGVQFASQTGSAFTSNLTTSAISGSVIITSSPFIVPNGDFERGDLGNWTCTTVNGSCTCAVGAGTKISGTYGAENYGSCNGVSGSNMAVHLLNTNDQTLATYSQAENVNGAQKTVDLTAYSTQTLKLRFRSTTVNNTCDIITSTFTAVSSASWRANTSDTCPAAGGSYGWIKLDDVKVNRYFSHYQSSAVFSFISRPFDMGVSTPVGGTFTASSTTPPGTSLSYRVRSATAAAGVWGTLASQTNLTRITENNRFYQYVSSFTTEVGTSTPRLDDVTVVAATTTTYITKCIEPGSGISAWGTLEVSGYRDGVSSFTFSNSTGTSCATLGLPLVNVTTGTTISIAVAPAYQIKVHFGLSSGTETARIDSIRVNWSEGAVAPPTYGAFWNDDLYWAVANDGTSNNRTLKYDLLYRQWYVFDLPMNAPFTFNNIMYFGGATNGKIYKYSNIDYSQAPSSDDGAVINAYYRTKEYGGADPFVENIYDRISLVAKKQSGGTMTSTWALNGGGTATGSYDVELSTGDNVVRRNYAFPAGRRGSFLNLKFSNNSTSPFEVLGVKVEFTPQTWRTLP